jgi:hypothetical protein
MQGMLRDQERIDGRQTTVTHSYSCLVPRFGGIVDTLFVRLCFHSSECPLNIDITMRQSQHLHALVILITSSVPYPPRQQAAIPSTTCIGIHLSPSNAR